MLNTITVSQLNTYVKALVENDVKLVSVSVCGEISNFKNHFSSGHWYFTLKDANASIRCVMFRASTSRVKFNVQDGVAVVLKGRVSIYEKDGQYQFYAEEMHTTGEGDLALAFKQVKEKLEKEGLFNIETKRPIIKYPKNIAVVTSDTGAAVRDILNIINSRYPACKIIMCPVLVQGDMASKSMITALDKLYQLNDIDTIIIGRGGGSAEDLHCFNDEELARKIYESPFTVISAVGHETDFTICDFVADVRASTPSHAAELATPDIISLKNDIKTFVNLLNNKMKYRFDYYSSKIQTIEKIISYSNVERLFADKYLEVDRLTEKINNCIDFSFNNNAMIFSNLVNRINALSPLNVMTRGFSVVYKNDVCISNVKDINVGDNIKIKFNDGNVHCIVTDKD